MKVALGCDHAGIVLKAVVIKVLKQMDIEFVDFGTFFTEFSVDYPDFAAKVCAAVVSGNVDKGILMCGTGIGMSIAANKFKGIRCAHVTDEFCAKMSAEHNNANVIAIGARITSEEMAEKIVAAYLTTQFDPRHQKRLDKIKLLEG